MLIEDISNTIKSLRITSLDISFNELADMYSSGELIIDPSYQRIFRWDLDKQSRFIESILLEMPIPPIYAIEIDDGKYELIDGLQRISTYLSFRGMLKTNQEDIEDESLFDQDQYDEGEAEETDTVIKNGFPLQGCDIIPSLNDLTFDDLPASLKIKAKRAFVRMDVLRKGINPEMKYHMFKRLNTGGEKLSAQEIRNCSLRLISNRFIDYVNELAKDNNFRVTIHNVSVSQIKKKFAEELVVRFFAFKNDRDAFSHDVDKFLTGYMEKVSIADVNQAPIFDYEHEKEVFCNIFKWLNESMGKDAFAVYKGPASEKLTGFNVYQFEAITSGMLSYYQELASGLISMNMLHDTLVKVKKDQKLIDATIGGGKNSTGVYEARVSAVRNALGELHERTT